MYKSIIRPLLFRLTAEDAHHFTFSLLKFAFKIPLIPSFFRMLYDTSNPKHQKEVFGIKFKNMVGLAAGFDKNALLVDEFAALGFGFVEIGTVTPRPQAGNDKPRLFRLPPDQAIINRMGFNNDGVDVIAERLRKRKSTIVVGGNIGKNKTTPNDEAVNDYLICFEKLFDTVDYFVVNVSSPNTPNLRELQEKEPLQNLLQTLQNENLKKPSPKPILLKIAPDLTNGQLDDIVEIVQQTKIAGLIATNTTIARSGLQTSASVVSQIGMGGLSGKPLSSRSTEVIQYLAQKSGGTFPIVGVGGIYSASDANQKLEAGAALVQLYSGYIYEGPGLVKAILEA
jgi:dihydroorotate dehydrogenase